MDIEDPHLPHIGSGEIRKTVSHIDIVHKRVGFEASKIPRRRRDAHVDHGKFLTRPFFGAEVDEPVTIEDGGGKRCSGGCFRQRKFEF